MSNNFGIKGYLKGTMLLTVAAFVVKILSAIYRVPFQNIVGDEGYYIYQQVYPFIAIFVVWTSSGLAVAISKILAEENINENHVNLRSFIVRIIFQYLTLLSFAFFAILFFGAGWFALMMGDRHLAPLLKTGAFVTLFIPILAVIKGIFQSKGEMTPIAYAQIMEQTVRVSIILVGTYIVTSTTSSLYDAGKIAIFGTVMGELVVAFVLIRFLKTYQVSMFSSALSLKKWPIIREVTVLSISMSMSSLLMLCFQLIDSFTIYSMLLDLGIDEHTAKETKGIYDRGLPLVQFGTVIASSLVLSVVPLIAYHSKKENKRAREFIQLTFRTSLVFSVAQGLGLVLIMPYANVMLFETDALNEVLKVVVLQIIPLSVILPFTAILQGMGKILIPSIIVLGMILFKLVGNLLFIKEIGIMGAAISGISSLSIGVLFLIFYLKRVKSSLRLADYSFYIKLFLASFSMVLAVLVCSKLLQMVWDIENRMIAVIGGSVLIVIGAVVFLTVIAKFRVLREKEWFLLPFGRKMARYQLWLNYKK